MFDFETWSTIAFLAALVALAIYDRKNIEFKYGVIIRRTERGKKWIEKFGEKHRKFFSYFGLAAIVFGIVASIISMYFLIQSTYNILARPDIAKPGVQFIIPKVPSEAVCNNALCVPFWYWIIGILTVLFSHELSHAMVARAEKIRIKSFGILSLVVLPGAFVEPSEAQLKRSKTLTKLKIFAAGSFGNLIVVLLSTLVVFAIFFVTDSTIAAAGVDFSRATPRMPAALSGLSGTITEVDGTAVRTLEEFILLMNATKPGDAVEIRTTTGTYTINTVASEEDPPRSVIGIENVTTKLVYKGVLSRLGEPAPAVIGVINWIINLFIWMNFLNLGVGMVNLLPIKPLDGGLIYEELLDRYLTNHKRLLINAVSIFTFALIILNVIGPGLISQITSIFLTSKFLTG